MEVLQKMSENTQQNKSIVQQTVSLELSLSLKMIQSPYFSNKEEGVLYIIDIIKNNKTGIKQNDLF